MAEKKKRNVIIGSLCAVVLLMGVGYAAFQSVLNINGISNISSNFVIKITNVTSKNIVGTASNNGEPTFENLSATFKTNLQSPGDSIEYEITVSNTGNINAKLDKYTLTDANNPIIKFTQTGLTSGEILNAGTTKTFIVKVEYLSSVTSQPTNVSSNLSITLDYSQADNGYVPSNQTASEQLTSNLVTTGDGLYEDTYETGRYVYKGANPNNYITFNNELWRIISIEGDNTIKIIKSNYLNINEVWDKNNIRVWRDSTLNAYLNGEYYNSLNSDSSSKIIAHNFYVGNVKYLANQTLETDISQEKSEVWNGKVGLINPTDYIRSSTDSACISIVQSGGAGHPCQNNNYLYHSDNSWWTINNGSSKDWNGVWFIGYTGHAGLDSAVSNVPKIYPTIYLKSDITLSGAGTSLNPYTIN